MRLKLWFRSVLIRLTSFLNGEIPPKRENNPQGEPNERHAVGDQHTADQIAALIHQNKTLMADIAAARETHERQQDLEHLRDRRPLWVAAGITAIYAVFAGEQWWTMRTELSLSDRPWVGLVSLISATPIPEPLANGKTEPTNVNVDITLQNFGKSPAEGFAINIQTTWWTPHDRWLYGLTQDITMGMACALAGDEIKNGRAQALYPVNQCSSHIGHRHRFRAILTVCSMLLVVLCTGTK